MPTWRSGCWQKPSDASSGVDAVGALGVVYASSLGGALFDVWLPTAPFVLVSIASGCVAAAAAYAIVVYKGVEGEDVEKKDDVSESDGGSGAESADESTLQTEAIVQL